MTAPPSPPPPPRPDDGNADADADADAGTPVPVLRELALEASPDFDAKVERRIERRRLAGELGGLAWHAPVEALLALLRAAFGLVAPGRDASRPPRP